MSKYISCTDTAKLIRKELKTNFPGIKFSVKSSSYAGGASISISWTDGPACPTVEKVTNRFKGASFDGMTDSTTYHTSELDGEEVRFGSDYVSCSRSTSMSYVKAIVAAYCARWGHDISKIKIHGNEERAYVDAYSLGISEDYWFNEIFHTTDAQDMHRPYEAKEEREQAEREEWVRNEPQRQQAEKARQEKEAAERAKADAARRQREQAQAKTRQEQEERRQQSTRQKREIFHTREQALAYLGLSASSSETMIKTIFKMRVKNASDGKGGYTEDMDKLVKAKEKALQK